MTDAGEKGRPPGDPPDKVVSWVSKVIGGEVGGRSAPEKVLNSAFVSERLQVEFPDGEDGEPVITIGSEVLDVMKGLWKQCIIVKVLGRNVAISALSRKLRELWKPNGGMYVLDLPRQCFMIRFDREDEYHAALTGGPWKVFGSYLLVQDWSPDFNPLRDDIVTTPVWVRLSNIPVIFYQEDILLGIASGLGKPVKVDLTTLHIERARFARVCVEVNLSKPLKGSVMINGERYYVAYEGMSNICSGCGVFGHLVHNCPRRPVEPVVEQPIVAPPQVINQQGDGFTAVRRPGRNTSVPADKVVFAAGGRSERNLRINSGNGNKETMTISNKFGSLVEDTIASGLREVVISNEENKENEGITQGGNQGKSVTQDRAAGGSFEKKKKGQRVALKETKVGSNKPNEFNGPRPKVIKNRPTRGLVFGSQRKDGDLAVSGKRLRVEEGFVGRPGGVFTPESGDRLRTSSLTDMNPTSTEASREESTENPHTRATDTPSAPSAVGEVTTVV
ncbi:hypothetical protein CARUB_v10015820mg [Capsella rubella]|uniref:DUF4283 domain-containing protein n=1 Tax=Capsella rubella TaxID=81985 RepID=R0I003_9BRAS|nr:hypothetical protein CARUB_v10015820mg [Capsella rubella]